MPKKISATERALVYDAYLISGKNLNATARATKLARNTCRKIIQEIEENETPATRQARADALAKLAEKAALKANEIIESITPMDLESGRFPIYDKDGKLAGYKYFGPGPVQKATAAGIMADKVVTLGNAEKSFLESNRGSQLLLPGSNEELLAAIAGKVESLQAINVRFRQDNPELATKIDAAAIEVEPEEPQDVQSSDEFYNPRRN